MLLGELRALAADIPNFDQFTPTSYVHQSWLGKLHALVSRWNQSEARNLELQASFIGIQLSRSSSVSNVVRTLHRAIADLELKSLNRPSHVFGPGAVYDFFKALRELLASAAESVFVIDPYMDDQIFDTYVSSLPQGLSVRLLTHKNTAALAVAAERFVKQRKTALEVRQSDVIHDRVIFLDRRSCWVLGQSLKDAAKSKATYLAPLDLSTVPLKLAIYETTWESALPVQRQ